MSRGCMLTGVDLADAMESRSRHLYPCLLVICLRSLS